MSSNRLLNAALAAGLLMALDHAAHAAVDLAALQVLPQRGQSADQARRDRYECHNWAVGQTGGVPPRGPSDDEAAEIDRAERVDRVINGASIGAALGGLIRAVQDKDPSHGVLSGAAVGAAVGAATAGREAASEQRDAGDDYVRALSACLEARGYSVAVPD